MNSFLYFFQTKSGLPYYINISKLESDTPNLWSVSFDKVLIEDNNIFDVMSNVYKKCIDFFKDKEFNMIIVYVLEKNNNSYHKKTSVFTRWLKDYRYEVIKNPYVKVQGKKDGFFDINTNMIKIYGN
jgi:hypothetical protein